MELNEQEIREAVIERAVEAILSDWQRVEPIEKTVRQRFEKLVVKAVQPHVDAAIEAGLSEQFTPTTSYGEQTGGPMTMRELIAKRVDEALTVRDRSRRSYNSDTPLEKFLEQEVAKQMQTALHAQMQEIAKQVQTAAAEAIGARVKQMVRA